MNCQDIKETLVRMPDSTFSSVRLRHSRRGTRRRAGSGGPVHGFTMIEILIVVVILAIAAMTAIPMMSSAGTVQLKAAANMIAADLEYAKSLAISRGQNFTVVFDTGAESYTIKDQGGATVPHPVKKGFDYVVDLANEGLGKVDIASVDFDGSSQIQFDYLGSPDNGGDVQLQTGGTTTTVSVEPVTGYISISQ